MKNVFVLFSSSLLTLLSVSQQKKNKEVKKISSSSSLASCFLFISLSFELPSSYFLFSRRRRFSTFLLCLLALLWLLLLLITTVRCVRFFPFIFLPLSLFPIQMPKLKVQLLFSSLLLVNVPRRRRRLQLFIKKET